MDDIDIRHDIDNVKFRVNRLKSLIGHRRKCERHLCGEKKETAEMAIRMIDRHIDRHLKALVG